MDKYNSRLAKLAKFIARDKSLYYAITLNQTSFYSCDESKVNPGWRAHEDKHKEQWKRDGIIKFTFRYLWQAVTKGYENIDYEIEAKIAGREA